MQLICYLLAVEWIAFWFVYANLNSYLNLLSELIQIQSWRIETFKHTQRNKETQANYQFGCFVIAFSQKKSEFQIELEKYLLVLNSQPPLGNRLGFFYFPYLALTLVRCQMAWLGIIYIFLIYLDTL